MRIVAVADTHLFHAHLALPDGDVLIHAGDLCRRGDLAELEVALAWMRSLPYRWKVLVAGNHDRAFQEAPDAARALLGDIHYLQDSGIVLDGLRLWGSPWQPAYNDWAFNLPRGEALAERWRQIPPGLDVLVTHGPCHGIGDRSPVAARAGCADLRQRIEEVQPRLHLFGHIHQDGGLWRVGGTVFANVTTWECERQATVIDIDREGVAAVTVPPP